MADSPPPKDPALSPQAFRIVAVGVPLFLAIMVADVALELTGHGGSALASVLTKALAAAVGVASTIYAARAPSSREAVLERKLAESTRPPPP